MKTHPIEKKTVNCTVGILHSIYGTSHPPRAKGRHRVVVVRRSSLHRIRIYPRWLHLTLALVEVIVKGAVPIHQDLAGRDWRARFM